MYYDLGSAAHHLLSDYPPYVGRRVDCQVTICHCPPLLA
jgi:hypothetical protein